MGKQLNPRAFNAWVYDHIDDYSHPLEVYYGGAGSGKSYGALQKIILKAMNSRRKVLVVRKVGATLRDSVFQLAIDLISDAKLLRSCEVSRTDMRIAMPNGSLLLFKGLDDREKIKSITGITDIVIEEATELSEDDFTQLRLRLRPPEPQPQIYLMFNPVSKANWVYGYFFAGKPPDGTRIIQTTYRDNRFLPAEYVATLEELASRNPAYYRIYALGEFATLDKLVYPHAEKRLIPAEETAGKKFWVGLDFGYVNDPSAIVWGYYDDSERAVYVTGEYVKTGMLNNELATTVQSLGLAKEIIIADSAEPKSIDELKRAGLHRIRPSKKGPDSVTHGVQWIGQCRLIIDERCVHTIEETENYTWRKDKKTGEYLNEPEDNFNHCLDAMRYGLQSVTGERRMKTVSKSILGL